MKAYKFIFPLLFVTILFQSCQEKPEIHTIIGNGNIVSEWRHCAEFSSVIVNDNFIIQIYNDDTYAIEIEAESNLIYHIKYDIEKKTMTLKTEDNYILETSSNLPIRIKIFTPGNPEIALNGSSIIYYNEVELEKCALSLRDNSKAYFTNSNITNVNITLSGQSSVESDDFTADIIKMSAVLSSKIKMRSVTFNSADIISQTAGDCYFTGTCSKGKFTIKSSGDIDTRDMITSNCTITIDSSGSIYAHVTNSIEGVINGSGNLYLKGIDNIDNVYINGTGNIFRL